MSNPMVCIIVIAGYSWKGGAVQPQKGKGIENSAAPLVSPCFYPK
ncbi:MAG: hypothetical protein U0V18_09960 [Anaerolineales bacterium]